MTYSGDIIDEALRLDGSSQQLSAHYRTWASRYNHDVNNVHYQGPCVIRHIFSEVVPEHIGRPNITVLDAGCGTGLVGLQLKNLDASVVDGIDLSPEMIVEAMKTDVYRILISGIDLNLGLGELTSNYYDITVSCGVFTPGHVRPVAINGLLRVTRPGGIIIVSTRKSYLVETDFEAHLESLTARRHLHIVGHLRDRPYLIDERADYWILKKA
jgi:predicted TPR repeat methyltransferase